MLHFDVIPWHMSDIDIIHKFADAHFDVIPSVRLVGLHIPQKIGVKEKHA